MFDEPSEHQALMVTDIDLKAASFEGRQYGIDAL